jgi:hypothetical protein
MPREVWGTYSVTDHKAPRAFIADVMLYDRLVLPVPMKGEWELWEQRQWAPDRLETLRKILEEKDRVQCIEWKVGQWDKEKEDYQNQMKGRYAFNERLAGEIGRDAFLYTRTRLVDRLPRSVTGIQAVPTYSTYDDFAEAVGFSVSDNKAAPIPLPPHGLAAASIGVEFLVPESPEVGDKADEALLKAAIDISSDDAYRNARRSFWRWQREFFGDDVITDQKTLEAAAEEMSDLLADVQRAYKWDKAKTIAKFAFLIGSVGLGMIGGPLAPVSIAGFVLTVGEFSFGQLADRHDKREPSPAALVYTAKKQLK